MNQLNPIRILIVDDHAMVRSGLRMFLMAFDDLELAGEAVNGFEAINLAVQLKPDVILMDLIMPSLDGLHATYEIHKKLPQIKIIALTSFTDPQLIYDAIEAGVAGYLFKNTTANELANAIRSVHAGNSIFSPEVAQALMKFTAVSESKITDLTARERAVLALIIAGKSNAEISEALTLSLSTTKFHVSNILSKMNAHNRGEVISIAIKNHLVDLSGYASR
jgi:NarL family two-component system response regulator LiaR